MKQKTSEYRDTRDKTLPRKNSFEVMFNTFIVREFLNGRWKIDPGHKLSKCWNCWQFGSNSGLTGLTCFIMAVMYLISLIMWTVSKNNFE